MSRRRVASYGADATLRVWNVRTGREVRQLKLDDLAPYPRALAFDPRHERFATVHADQTIRVRDLLTGRELQRFRAAIQVKGLSFSPDGRLLAGGSYQAAVYLWTVSRPQRKTAGNQAESRGPLDR